MLIILYYSNVNVNVFFPNLYLYIFREPVKRSMRIAHLPNPQGSYFSGNWIKYFLCFFIINQIGV